MLGGQHARSWRRPDWGRRLTTYCTSPRPHRFSGRNERERGLTRPSARQTRSRRRARRGVDAPTRPDIRRNQPPGEVCLDSAPSSRLRLRSEQAAVWRRVGGGVLVRKPRQCRCVAARAPCGRRHFVQFRTGCIGGVADRADGRKRLHVRRHGQGVIPRDDPRERLDPRRRGVAAPHVLVSRPTVAGPHELSLECTFQSQRVALIGCHHFAGDAVLTCNLSIVEPQADRWPGVVTRRPGNSIRRHPHTIACHRIRSCGSLLAGGAVLRLWSRWFAPELARKLLVRRVLKGRGLGFGTLQLRSAESLAQSCGDLALCRRPRPKQQRCQHGQLHDRTHFASLEAVARPNCVNHFLHGLAVQRTEDRGRNVALEQRGLADREEQRSRADTSWTCWRPSRASAFGSSAASRSTTWPTNSTSKSAPSTSSR